MKSLVRREQESALSAEMKEKIAEYLGASHSDNTRKAYTRQWQRFATWCAKHGQQALPCAPLTLAAYLTDWASHPPVSVASLRQAITAICEMHRDYDHPLPYYPRAAGNTDIAKGARQVHHVLSGIKRKIGTDQRQAKPVTVPVLEKIIAATDNTLRGKRDKALILIGVACAMRRSELVALNIESVERTDKGVLLNLGRTKTNQTGSDHAAIVRSKNKVLCPVAALDAWLAAAKIKQGPLFREIENGSNAILDRLTAQSVRLRVIAAIKRVYTPDESVGFSGHSLRSGFATSAAAEGTPTHLIKRQGRWKSSQTLDRYIRDEELFHSNPTETLFNKKKKK